MKFPPLFKTDICFKGLKGAKNSGLVQLNFCKKCQNFVNQHYLKIKILLTEYCMHILQKTFQNTKFFSVHRIDKYPYKL